MEQISFIQVLSLENNIHEDIKKLEIKRIILGIINSFKLIILFNKNLLKYILRKIFLIARFILNSKLIKLIPRKIKLKIKSKIKLYPRLYYSLISLRSYIQKPRNKKIFFKFFLVFSIKRVYFPILDIVLNKASYKNLIFSEIKKRIDLQIDLRKILVDKRGIYNLNKDLYFSQKIDDLPLNINEVYIKLRKEICYYQNNNFNL